MFSTHGHRLKAELLAFVVPPSGGIRGVILWADPYCSLFRAWERRCAADEPALSVPKAMPSLYYTSRVRPRPACPAGEQGWKATTETECASRPRPACPDGEAGSPVRRMTADLLHPRDKHVGVGSLRTCLS